MSMSMSMSMSNTRRKFLRNVTGSIALGWVHLRIAEGLQAKLDGTSVTDAIERLKPGEYLWAPAVAPTGPVLAIVSLPVAAVLRVSQWRVDRSFDCLHW